MQTAVDVSSESPPQDVTITDANIDTTSPSVVIVDSQKEKRQCTELGFVEKLIELWKLRKRISEDKAEITVSGFLQRYTHEMGKAVMSKAMNFRSTYISKLFKAKNKELNMDEKSRASIAIYNYEIAVYKALLMQCEKDFDLMINVQLYQELVIPHFTLKHGQYAAVAVIRSGVNKLLKKVWEAYINKRDKLILREHAKVVQNQRKFDTQLQTAQMSAGQQIDLRIDTKFADLDATIRSVIKDTVKNQYIKKESFAEDESHSGKEPFQYDKQSYVTQGFQQSKSSSKRSRNQEPIDLRSPTTSTPNQRKKKQEQRFFPQGVPLLHIFSKS